MFPKGVKRCHHSNFLEKKLCSLIKPSHPLLVFWTPPTKTREFCPVPHGVYFSKKSMMPWWERFFPWLRRHVNSTWIWRMGIFGLFLTFCHYRQRLNLAGCKEVEVKLRVVGALARKDWWKKGYDLWENCFGFRKFMCKVHGSYYFDDTFYMVSLHVSPTL